MMLVAVFSDGARCARAWDGDAVTQELTRTMLKAARPGCKVFSKLETPDCLCISVVVTLVSNNGAPRGSHQWFVEDK